MNADAERALALLITKHMALLGPAAALSLARNISGITVAENGDVLRMTRDPNIVFDELERTYASFAGTGSRVIARSLHASLPDRGR